MDVSRPAATLNRKLIHALLAVAYLAAGGVAQAAARVWVVDDGLRIDPRTGKAFEESIAHPEALRIKPGYRDANWIFDARTKQVRFAGARNDVLAFQVQMESDAPLAGVNLTVSDLKGPAPFPARENIRLFKELYVEVKRRIGHGTNERHRPRSCCLLRVAANDGHRREGGRR